MDATRAAMIRKHWREYRSVGARYLRTRGVFSCPVDQPVSVVACLPDVMVPELHVDVLHFTLQRGKFGPYTAVVCDGLEVEVCR